MKNRVSAVLTVSIILCALCLLSSCTVKTPRTSSEGPTSKAPSAQQSESVPSKDPITPSTEPYTHEPISDAAVEASCTGAGKTEGSHCTVCNEVLTAQQEVPAKGHDWADATCLKPKTCTVCSKTEGTVSAHNYKDSVRTVCHSRKPSEGLAFKLNEDGESYTVTGLGSCKDTDLLIPATYKDKPVTAIGERAFYLKSRLTAITISEGIQSIGKEAFMGCTALADVSLPDSINSIGESAFLNCQALVSIVLPKGITSIESQTFSDCTGLVSITIPEKVTHIGLRAFYGCNGLQEITISSSVTSIDTFAFSNCTSLRSIVIPDSVKTLQWSVFARCTNLTTIWCEAASLPTDWDSEWKTNCSAAVHWGGEWDYANGVPTLK